jgi:hypothetical protein
MHSPATTAKLAAAHTVISAGAHLLHEQLQPSRHGCLPGLPQDGVEGLLPVLNAVVQTWQQQQAAANQASPT